MTETSYEPVAEPAAAAEADAVVADDVASPEPDLSPVAESDAGYLEGYAAAIAELPVPDLAEQLEQERAEIASRIEITAAEYGVEPEEVVEWLVEQDRVAQEQHARDETHAQEEAATAEARTQEYLVGLKDEVGAFDELEVLASARAFAAENPDILAQYGARPILEEAARQAAWHHQDAERRAAELIERVARPLAAGGYDATGAMKAADAEYAVALMRHNGDSELALRDAVRAGARAGAGDAILPEGALARSYALETQAMAQRAAADPERRAQVEAERNPRIELVPTRTGMQSTTQRYAKQAQTIKTGANA